MGHEARYLPMAWNSGKREWACVSCDEPWGVGVWDWFNDVDRPVPDPSKDDGYGSTYTDAALKWLTDHDRELRDRLAFIDSIDAWVRGRLYGKLPDDEEFYDLRTDLAEFAFYNKQDPSNPEYRSVMGRIEKYVERKRAEMDEPRMLPARKKRN